MTTRRIVVDHVLFVVGDLAASRQLYTAALGSVGYEELHVQQDGVHYGVEGLDDFAIYQGAPIFEAAVANGATARGELGVWTQYSERYYAGFVNDLHGNNVEAVWHAPEPVKDAPVREGVP